MSRSLPIAGERRPASGRTCGTCSLCCTVLAVVDLRTPEHPDGKEQNTRCAHLRRGAIGGSCSIYAERPTSCAEFSCLWLTGHLPADLKPEKIRAVADVNATGDVLVFHVAPADRGAWRKGALARFLADIKDGTRKVSVIIVCGEERIAYGPIAKDVEALRTGITIEYGNGRSEIAGVRPGR